MRSGLGGNVVAVKDEILVEPGLIFQRQSLRVSVVELSAHGWKPQARPQGTSSSPLQDINDTG